MTILAGHFPSQTLLCKLPYGRNTAVELIFRNLSLRWSRCGAKVYDDGDFRLSGDRIQSECHEQRGMTDV